MLILRKSIRIHHIPVVSLMPEQIKKLLGEGYGGTMRLGSYPCNIKPGTLAYSVYNSKLINERHRHRYEVNNEYRDVMKKEGLVFSGLFEQGDLVEIIELSQKVHPFYTAVQFHPEFKSRPLDAHPLFKAFADACKKHALPQIRVEKTILPEVVKPIVVQLGTGLLKFTEDTERQNLKKKFMDMGRIIANETGMMLPEIHIEINQEAEENSYSIMIRGNSIASGKLYRDKFLVIAPESMLDNLKGEQVYEPAFGYPGKWVTRNSLKKAEQQGAVIMTGEEVLMCHCAYVIKTHIDELVGRQEVNNLLENLKQTHPALAEEVLSGNINLGRITKIIRNLLKEQVPVKDFVTIMEAVADNLEVTADVEILTDLVRKALARTITGKYVDKNHNIDVIILDPSTEEMLVNELYESEMGSYLALNSEVGAELLGSLDNEITKVRETGKAPICVVPPKIRMAFRKLTERPFPDLVVLSWNEIPPEITINPTGTLELDLQKV
jgi:flagellar biosynthesis component FlhA